VARSRDPLVFGQACSPHSLSTPDGHKVGVVSSRDQICNFTLLFNDRPFKFYTQLKTWRRIKDSYTQWPPYKPPALSYVTIGCQDIWCLLQRFWFHDVDLLGSRDVIDQVAIYNVVSCMVVSWVWYDIHSQGSSVARGNRDRGRYFHWGNHRPNYKWEIFSTATLSRLNSSWNATTAVYSQWRQVAISPISFAEMYI